MASYSEDLTSAALAYHRLPRPGKLEIQAIKPLANQRDLALAYSPGVAAACMAISADPREAAELTARANLVAVVTNGTAVLGLGNIGPLASKPVMEGKAVLFKKFAGIDVFDIEIAADTIDKVVEAVAALEPTFGGINLEDIKGPECFEIETRLKERMKIPVFHDDQHGTAIIVGAAIKNALLLKGKKLEDVKIVASGAGAAAIACLNLLVSLGAQRKNIWVVDIDGVVHEGRNTLMDRWKAVYAQKTDKRVLAEVIGGADIFLGLSAPNVLTQDMVKQMADKPLVMALANPDPEIMPDEARAGGPDAMICTGRSDFPNQVNNVLCFPFIFRGALDVGATTINEAMKLAAVRAIADLAMAEQSDIVAAAYGDDQELKFGPEYLIPKPFDPRLIVMIAPAVAKAAMDSGVATRPIADFDAYHERLVQYVYHPGLLMKPIFQAAKKSPKRIVYAEGEEERVLRAVQVVVDEGLAKPILVGRPAVIERRLSQFGLRLKPGVDFEIINPESDPRYRDYWMEYYRLTERRGHAPQCAKLEMRRRLTLIGAMMIHMGHADGMLCGMFGTHDAHRHYVDQVIGLRPGVKTWAAMNAVLLPNRTVFIADTYVNRDPTAEQIAEIARLAAEEVRRFGIVPKVALVSHSSFGSSNDPQAKKMQSALALINAQEPELEVEGEMQGDAALSDEIRRAVFPNSRLKGDANLLIMPTLDAANISFNLLKVAAGSGLTLGPILLGVAKPVHILTASATVRRIVNMSALAVVDAIVDRQKPLL